jgi:hypothetical protein
MGEARRRKKALGFTYGTPAGSNRQEEPVLSFRYMTEQEIVDADFRLPPEHSFLFLVGSINGFEFPIAAKAVIDAWGKFNSYAYGKHGVDKIPGLPFRGKRKIKDGRDLNKFLLETADVCIVNEADQSVVYVKDQ